MTKARLSMDNRSISFRKNIAFVLCVKKKRRKIRIVHKATIMSTMKRSEAELHGTTAYKLIQLSHLKHSVHCNYNFLVKLEYYQFNFDLC